MMLPSGEVEVLLTSLLDLEPFPLADINKIYLLRWHIEECYKRLKMSTEIENFSGINLEAVLQKFWAHLVMCNTLALIWITKGFGTQMIYPNIDLLVPYPICFF
jgi:IS4 transposase